MDVALAYMVTELTDPLCPAKFHGAERNDIEGIARRILDAPENGWQRALQQNAMRCAALVNGREEP